MIKTIYAIFLGIMIALFLGWGIEVFYNSPKMPDYPSELSYAKGDLSTTQQAIQTKFDQDQKAYQEEMKGYNGNVSLIAFGLSLILFVISLVLIKGIPFVSDSILLGGAFTLVYGLGRGLASGNNKIQLLSAAIALIIAFVAGYFKFVKAEKS